MKERFISYLVTHCGLTQTAAQDLYTRIDDDPREFVTIVDGLWGTEQAKNAGAYFG